MFGLYLEFNDGYPPMMIACRAIIDEAFAELERTSRSEPKWQERLMVRPVPGAEP